jgi:hypothetical protein
MNAIPRNRTEFDDYNLIAYEERMTGLNTKQESSVSFKVPQ